jgi:aminoglycoside phosphotransferase (APT) family kinase protein
MAEQPRTISGLQKIAEGREAEIFAWEDGSVLRLLRNPNAAQQVEWEAHAMAAARGAGASVPEVLGKTTIDGRPGLIMERVDGVDLLTIVGRKPWLVWSVAQLSGRMQAQLNSSEAPPDIPSLKDLIRRRVTQSGRVPPHLADRALAMLDTVPDGDRICHGDLHPGNIIRSSHGHMIIDWTNVARGDATADFVRTDLMIRMGSIPPGSPIVIRYGALFARRLMLSTFRRSYLGALPLDKRQIARWEVPVVANRLCDGIEEERTKLLEILEGAA